MINLEKIKQIIDIIDVVNLIEETNLLEKVAKVMLVFYFERHLLKDKISWEEPMKLNNLILIKVASNLYNVHHKNEVLWCKVI